MKRERCSRLPVTWAASRSRKLPGEMPGKTAIYGIAAPRPPQAEICK